MAVRKPPKNRETPAECFCIKDATVSRSRTAMKGSSARSEKFTRVSGTEKERRSRLAQKGRRLMQKAQLSDILSNIVLC